MPKSKRRPKNLKPEDIKYLTEEIVEIEPPVDSKLIAVSAFFGGVVAYVIWILVHKLFAMIGLSEVASFIAAQSNAVGEAGAAGVSAAGGGYVTSAVYKTLKKPLGIDSDPPPPPPGGGNP